MYVYIYIYIYIYKHVLVYMYTHTRSHTYKDRSRTYNEIIKCACRNSTYINISKYKIIYNVLNCK